MRISVGFDGLAATINAAEGSIASAATESMRETMPIAKQELRDQITSSGLGGRLANTWRGDVYPKSRQSVNPAGYIHSTAPDIIDSFSRGAQIVPINGAKFLAIPTKNVPRAIGRRGASRRMTPEQVEATYNQDLFYKRGRAGRLLAFLNPDSQRRGRGAGRQRSGGGKSSVPVLMFVMVPAVRMPKLLDLDGVAERWGTRFTATFTQRLGPA